MKTDFNSCCGSVCGFVTFVMAICIFSSIIIPYMDYNDYEEHSCNITKVNYPTTLPNKNNTFGWKNCNCGRSCNKAYTPCIQMFSNINPNIVIQENYFSDYSNSECTFYQRKCKDGEDIILAQEKLEEAKNIFNKYYNNTVKCYYNSKNQEIFLDMSYDKISFITLLTCFTIALMCTIIQCLIYCSNEKKENEFQLKTYETKKFSSNEIV